MRYKGLVEFEANETANMKRIKSDSVSILRLWDLIWRNCNVLMWCIFAEVQKWSLKLALADQIIIRKAKKVTGTHARAPCIDIIWKGERVQFYWWRNMLIVTVNCLLFCHWIICFYSLDLFAIWIWNGIGSHRRHMQWSGVWACLFILLYESKVCAQIIECCAI